MWTSVFCWLLTWTRLASSSLFFPSMSLPKLCPWTRAWVPLSVDSLGPWLVGPSCKPPKSLAAAAAKSLQSCPTLCDPPDSSPPGSPVPGILQARTLEWVAISFSTARKWKVKVNLLSCISLLATPWTAAYQAPPSMGFSRQEYGSGVSLPSPPQSLR